MRHEARLLRGIDDLEVPTLGNMDLRLDEKKTALGFEGGQDLAEKALEAVDLMGHPENEREISLEVQSEGVLRGQMKPDPARDTGPLRAPPGPLEHRRLNVHSHDPTPIADHPGHGDGEVARSAADIESRVALSEKRAEDSDRIVGHPPEDVRQREGQPSGTKRFGQFKSLLGRSEPIYYAFGTAPLSI